MTADLIAWLRDVHARVEAQARAVSGGTVVGERGNWQPAPGGDEWAASHTPGLEVEVLVGLRPGLPRPPELRSGLWGQIVAWQDSDEQYGRDPADWLERQCLPLAQHVATHDPAAVLARVTAERALLDHHERWQTTLHVTPGGWTENGAAGYRMAMEWTVRHLAWSWCTQPGFDDGWLMWPSEPTS